MTLGAYEGAKCAACGEVLIHGSTLWALWKEHGKVMRRGYCADWVNPKCARAYAVLMDSLGY